MNKLYEAFQFQMNETVPLAAADFSIEDRIQFTQNDFTPGEWVDLVKLHDEKSKYSSGKLKSPGERVLKCWIISNAKKPVLVTLGDSEIKDYQTKFRLVRSIDNSLPVITPVEDEYEKKEGQEVV